MSTPSSAQIELPGRMNAATLFVDANVEAGRGDKVAIIDASSGASCTYRELQARTNRTGNALRALGVRREERVMLLLFDTPEFAFSFFGAIKIGAVPVPTNTMLTPADYEYLLNDSRARVLIIAEALLPQIEPIREQLTYLEEVVVVGEPLAAGQRSFAELVDAASPALEAEMLHKDDPCFWLYSSGTTGFPKGAIHLQHDMIVAAEHYAIQTLGIRQDDTAYSVAKLFFAYGLGNGLYFPLRVGATTVLSPDRPSPTLAYEIIEAHRPTLFFSVPTAYASMLAIEDASERYDASSLRLCVSAGESLPAVLYERWRARHGTEILDGIGSTEILHIFISNREGRVRPGSSGELVPGYEARLLDEDGSDVPVGEVGDLLIKGDSTCAAYWNKHEQTKDTIEGHWIRTGDKYIRDEDGYFWYQGRGDDMLKVGGIWVSPVEVENVLSRHPAVLESAVVGARDADDLIKPKAFVVLANPADVDAAALASELRAFVQERTARYKYPRWIEIVEELPKTATGKTQRYKLRGDS